MNKTDEPRQGDVRLLSSGRRSFPLTESRVTHIKPNGEVADDDALEDIRRKSCSNLLSSIQTISRANLLKHVRVRALLM
jgi:hypothetical protein